MKWVERITFVAGNSNLLAELGGSLKRGLEETLGTNSYNVGNTVSCQNLFAPAQSTKEFSNAWRTRKDPLSPVAVHINLRSNKDSFGFGQGPMTRALGQSNGSRFWELSGPPKNPMGFICVLAHTWHSLLQLRTQPQGYVNLWESPNSFQHGTEGSTMVHNLPLQSQFPLLSVTNILP